ncbi:di-trans,poly-cis-decaprenylcistransferase, partial [Mesorhizobium sp. M4A.F.Ca.ET.050.02.1.1]
TLVIAFNYGGRDEIVRAARKLAAAAGRGEITAEAITAEAFAGALDTDGIPDPELVIRTSGELRLSNFLLWQAAYSELVFLPCYWPDFSREHLADALRDFASRERRFGGLAAQDVAS